MEISDIIEQFIINYGLISIFIVVALEYANAPLPSEIVLPMIGILALEFNMNLLVVILVSIAGGIFGSIINYYLGYKLGEPLLAFIKNKYPKTKKSIKSSYRWLIKYEKISVMLSRLVPIARTFISIVAGVTKMNVITFTIYSTIGISIWNIILITLGYILGENINIVSSILKNYSLVIATLIVTAFTYIVVKKYKKYREIKEERGATNE